MLVLAVAEAIAPIPMPTSTKTKNKRKEAGGGRYLKRRRDEATDGVARRECDDVLTPYAGIRGRRPVLARASCAAASESFLERGRQQQL